MATRISTLITRVRSALLAPSAATGAVNADLFWSDDELLDWMTAGAQDLWRSFVDLHEAHFLTVDITNVSLAASTATLTGIPADCYRVSLIQPRDTTSTSSTRFIRFQPADYNSDNFIGALSMDTFDPSNGGVIFYAITQAGPPSSTMTIYVAPQITTALNLRFVYTPTLATTLSMNSVNPIPGQSDQALVTWTLAFARAKEREDRSPDPNDLAVYATEKQACLVVSAPRQEQEPRVVKGIWDGLDDFGMY